MSEENQSQNSDSKGFRNFDTRINDKILRILQLENAYDTINDRIDETDIKSLTLKNIDNEATKLEEEIIEMLRWRESNG